MYRSDAQPTPSRTPSAGSRVAVVPARARVTVRRDRLLKPVHAQRENLRLPLDNYRASGIMDSMETFTTALKEAIRSAGRGLPTIADESGVNKGQLSRFMRDQRDLTLGTADRVLAGLGLSVRLVRQRGKTKGR